MTPYYEDDAVTIYHGDCRDALLDVPAVSCDALITDPPYGMAYTPKGAASAAHAVAGDGVRQGVRFLRSAIAAADGWLGEDAHLLTFCHWQSLPDFMDALAVHGKIRNALVWHKGGGLTGDTRKNYGRGDYEMVVYAGRGERNLEEMASYGSVIACPRVPPQRRTHPTEKPVELLALLVAAHARPTGVVLDPFAGSGSTLVAAKERGRRAIGIEIEERYCEVAAKRLAQEVLPLEMG